ncbi:translocon-associated protein subunit delta isoform X2 [Loxodonta africana]|uniref:translocon-associated protein subunit delta isoform X2 n=1 Tax=Loxodonta africana TaxID=9785 RepID=UPI000C812B72|nr:translocon-associated protein subunit delta isoform X2 [Loxodonta africana]XP_049727997.1 translocon-associated protein subunit delta isoform X1 [Elephas maximus indicus]
MAAVAPLGALALLLLSGLSCCSGSGVAGACAGEPSLVAPFSVWRRLRQRFLSLGAARSKGASCASGPRASSFLSLKRCWEACMEPQITPSYYTTSDAVISTETVFIVEISLTCKNRVQNMALYADVSGKQFPVTRGQDVGRYQVSWSLDHKSAHAGTYEVRFFDEESYSLLRKAQRNNEDISVIPPLFTVSVDHRGTWNGPWVSTEVLAAVVGLVIYYLAFSAKSHIQA